MNLAEIRTLAEIHSDTDQSRFPSLPQKNLFINDEARQLVAKFVNANFPVKRQVVTVTLTGAASYPLSLTSPLRIVAVRDSRQAAGGDLRPLRRANNLDRNSTQTYSGHPAYGAISETTWDIEVDQTAGTYNLLLFPPPTGGQVIVEAINSFPTMASDAAIFPFPDPAGSILALKAAKRFLRKEDQEAGRSIDADLAPLESEMWQIINSLAPPQRMEDWVSLMEGYSYDF